MHAPDRLPGFASTLDEPERTALREHDVVVERPGQPNVELDRKIVEGNAYVADVIGPDGHGIATRIAASEPAFLQHRDVGHAVVLGEVMGGTEAMSATANDNDVVLGPRLGAAPCALPAVVVCRRVAQDAEDRVALHHSRKLNTPTE